MANRNFNGAQFNQSPLYVEKAGEDIADVRNRIVTYDGDGNVVLATKGTDIPIGIAIIETGHNDITGVESGKVLAGEDVDILIKDIGMVLAGEDIVKGEELAAGEDGKAVAAAAGDYVIGVALRDATEDGYCMVQITKYQSVSGSSVTAGSDEDSETTD